MGMWVTIADAASMYRLPRSTVYAWIRDDRLTRNRAGRVSLLDVETLAARRIPNPADRLRSTW